MAAEKVGFTTVGKGYCNIVKRLFPLLAPEFLEGDYKNIKLLFFLWNNRIEEHKLEIEKKELERKISEQGKTYNIYPIGTES